MPITIHLDAMIVKRKISLTELSKAVGLSLTNLSMLKNGNVRGVRFETLEKICIVLDCQPGDLLECQPYTDEKNDGIAIRVNFAHNYSGKRKKTESFLYLFYFSRISFRTATVEPDSSREK